MKIPHFGTIQSKSKAAQPRFWPVSGLFWIRVGARNRVKVRVSVRDRGVGSALVP